MRTVSLSVVFSFCVAATASAQMRLGVFTGLANYMGDLNEAPYQSPRGAFGLSANFPLGPRLTLRAGLTFAKVAGADSLSSKAAFRARNLSFASPVTEFSLLGEYNLLDLDNRRWTPYAFAGVAVFHFNPFAYDGSQKVYLQPLGTEGQGIALYNRQPYALTGFSVPFGGGVKFVLSDKINLGIEAGLRKNLYRLFRRRKHDLCRCRRPVKSSRTRGRQSCFSQ